MKSSINKVFQKCVEAIDRGELIQRSSRTDKEFHFQKKISNPAVGKKHVFQAWRTKVSPLNKVSLKEGENATY